MLPIVCRPVIVPMVCRQWPTLILVTTTQYMPLLGYGHCRPTHGMPPIVCRPAIVPMVCRQWPTLILVPTTQYMPLLAMGTVGPPVVCRQWYAAQPSCPWCAAHPSCPWYAAHPYSWLSAHPSTSSISYTTYPSTYYTIYTTIGYGHCRPTRMHWHHNMYSLLQKPLGPPVYLVQSM
jgi:hypothetical protein